MNGRRVWFLVALATLAAGGAVSTRPDFGRNARSGRSWSWVRIAHPSAEKQTPLTWSDSTVPPIGPRRQAECPVNGADDDAP